MNDIELRLSNGDTAEEISRELGWNLSRALSSLNENAKKLATHYTLNRLSKMSRESDTDLKALYAEVFKCLLRGDPHLCHHYIFSRFHDITIPFDSWQEEVEAIARSSNLEERKIKEWYYDRCRKCRKHCNDRIIIPENGDPFWSIREYVLTIHSLSFYFTTNQLVNLLLIKLFH